MTIIKYEEQTWQELEKLSKDYRVVLIPTGTLEDHGYHLPINTDVVIPKSILEKVAEALPDETILFPEVVHGYSPHHMNFCGTTALRYDQFVEYLLSITGSLAQHGFNRMYILNGHGSNQALCTIAQQETNRKNPKVICMNSFYLNSPESLELIKKTRKSEFPGGMGHACELETSIMLHLRPDLVKIDKAVEEMDYPKKVESDFYMDWADGSLNYMPRWDEITFSGVQGNPTVATAKNGKLWFKQAVKEAVMRTNVVLNTYR